MTTVDGERAINYAYTEMSSSGDAPRPLGPSNKALGGGGFNVLTEGPVNGVGTNNVGLLIRAWGKVTATGSGYFYIDDGSNLSDGSGSTGVRVEGVITYMPDVDDYVAVTGISGLKTVSGNLARVVRVASSSDFTQSTPQPPDGSVTEGTNLFVHSSGQVFPLTGDGAVVSSSGEEGGYGILSAGWTPVELNGYSYGPYRRVSSRQESGHYYFGAGGNFVLPDRNGISLRGNKTTPYICLGSHAQDMTYGPSWVEVNAGLMWNRNFFRNTWDAYLFTNTAGKKSFGRARVNMGLGSDFRSMAGMSVYMAYWISFDTSILVIEGYDEYFNYKTVIMANAYGAMWYPAAIIKRVHSYATGSPDEYRNGSYVWGAEVSDMVLYRFATGGGTEAVWWTKDRTPPPPSGHQ